MSIQEARALLGVAANYTQEELKKAYRKMSKKYHPDIVGSGSNDIFMKVNEAYKTLLNPHIARSSGTLTHSSIFTIVPQ